MLPPMLARRKAQKKNRGAGTVGQGGSRSLVKGARAASAIQGPGLQESGTGVSVFGYCIVFQAVYRYILKHNLFPRARIRGPSSLEPNIAGLRDNLLDSSPFAAYSLELPKNAEAALNPSHLMPCSNSHGPAFGWGGFDCIFSYWNPKFP